MKPTKRAIAGRTLLALLAAGAVASAGCGRGGAALQQYDTNEVLKVSVLKSGEVLAGGAKVSLAELDALIASNAQKRGVIWYYREAGREEPPPQAGQVIQLVVKHKRPIRMSGKADFSGAIGLDGRSGPAN